MRTAKLTPRARRAGILLEVRDAAGDPVTRKHLAHRLNTTETVIKHDIEWLLKEGKLKFLAHKGSRGAIYKPVGLKAAQ
jgi:transcriptional antiterminator